MEITIAIASVVVALLALAVAARQAQEARRAREVAALLPLYQTFESKNCSEIRRKIRHAVEKPLGPAETPFELRVSPDEDAETRNYINHLNFIGVMVKRGLINRSDAVAIFGAAADRCQTACYHYIEKEQKKNKEFAAELDVLAPAPQSAPTL
jgi:hypothetical protein